MEGMKALIKNMERYVSVDHGLRSELASMAELTRIKKRQFIDQPGFISQYRNYIVEGAFRSYYIDSEGKEHVVQIALEDWFVSDFYSYITQTEATLFVEALEDSKILRFHYRDIEQLCQHSHALSEYFRISTERAFAFSRKRALSAISLSAEERYRELMNRYPGMEQRIPQKTIASYLGISAEFLSKIKKRISAS